MAAVARAGLQANRTGGSVRDPSGVRSFDAGGFKKLLRGYVGEAATLISPEYQRRANQHIGGAAAFAAGFIPSVGTITGIYGAITGTDLFSGQQISIADRVMGVIPGGAVSRVARSTGIAVLRQVHNQTKAFDIVPYGNKAPGFANHHAILDKWAAANIPGYVSRRADAPTIALTPDQHKAAHAAQYDWLEELMGKRTFQGLDWTKVTPRQINDLMERMYRAAGVPEATQAAYRRVWNQYIYEGKWSLP